ncbi:hypothetical protein CCAX7_10540 [Capsulimonas corticalis]|uniref:Glucosamine/galactosamine-6-phosphate isomerase domain-containing protein n=1 Tax=Capsulimonas corticalis TaxID=2219043 RepID=A0A402CUH4_9BACT|nr:glucosamine-6-phosphate deaminase [Capsulimonas corticalis]BDI29003.1 hypothetical protein CCAX7_10540 [Capsulimonas corticalis]
MLSELKPKNISISSDYAHVCRAVASRIADLVRAKPGAVLGLATGSSPLGVYAELIRMHREEGLDFSRVTSFNLDEYYPMSASSEHSYHAFMEANLFSQINIGRWYVPDGRSRGMQEILLDCRRYEERIADTGGLDLQLLGIGRTGHVGFNEPGSPRDSRTRLVTLHEVTRVDAAPGFGGLDQVPHQAVSMGIATIMDAREIVMMASGAGKAEIVRRALEGEETEQVPATLIRRHANARFYFDTDAARLLSAP